MKPCGFCQQPIAYQGQPHDCPRDPLMLASSDMLEGLFEEESAKWHRGGLLPSDFEPPRLRCMFEELGLAAHRLVRPQGF